MRIGPLRVRQRLHPHPVALVQQFVFDVLSCFVFERELLDPVFVRPEERIRHVTLADILAEPHPALARGRTERRQILRLHEPKVGL